ncbi:SIMPL domain-containing protein [Ferdinandcohnia sp. Marseille-Q9671]
MYYYEPWVNRTVPTRGNNAIQNRIKVIGEGTVKAVPDSATITLGVITENTTVTIAQEQNNEITKKVIDALIAAGIPNEQIKTVDFRIDIIYDYENSTQTLKGYRVTHMIQISGVPIEAAGGIVDTAVQNSANTVTSIDFTIQSPQAYYARALGDAVQDAQAKARTIANNVRVQLQETPIHMQELSQQSPPIPFQTAMFAKSEADTPLQPGELTISARIEATFIFMI